MSETARVMFAAGWNGITRAVINSHQLRQTEQCCRQWAYLTMGSNRRQLEFADSPETAYYRYGAIAACKHYLAHGFVDQR